MLDCFSTLGPYSFCNSTSLCYFCWYQYSELIESEWPILQVVYGIVLFGFFDNTQCFPLLVQSTKSINRVSSINYLKYVSVSW